MPNAVLAPSASSACTVQYPTGPSPTTAAVSSGVMAARLAPYRPVVRTSPTKSARSSSTSSGIASRLVSANGTRTRSACAPGRSPPKGPAPRIACSSHRAVSPRRQNQHDPHAIWNDTTTRSPGRTPCTSAPIDSTTPTASWPRTAPGSIGALPWRKWRSVPQIAALVTRTIASVGRSMTGAVTSVTSTPPPSANTTARTLALVREHRVHLAGEAHELVRRSDVSHDRGQVSADLELALHHPLDRVELAEHDGLPPRVRGAQDVRRSLTRGSVHHPAAPARPMPQVEVSPDVVGHVHVRLGLDQERDVALPVRGGRPVLLRSVDRHDEGLEPRIGRERRHVGTPRSRAHRIRGVHRVLKMITMPITLNATCAAIAAKRFARRP